MKTQTNANPENNSTAPRVNWVRTGSKTFKHRHERRRIREQLRRLDTATSVEDEILT
jgi:hypothetical protein